MATIGEMINNGDKDPCMLRYHGITGNSDHYPRKHAHRYHLALTSSSKQKIINVHTTGQLVFGLRGIIRAGRP